MSVESKFTRRKFLRTGVIASAATLGGTFFAMNVSVADAVAQASAPAAGATTTAPAVVRVFRGKMFFTNDLEFATLSAAVERIFPKDELGPGAVELAVPFFIDNQLASAYGVNAREYTKPPFFHDIAAPTQGWQTPLLNKDIFREGIRALNRQSQTAYQKNFPDLTTAQQDSILELAAAGRITIPGVSSSYFFSQLRDMTMAGAYADPIYNGNNNMDGWRMKKFPGSQMSFYGIMNTKEFVNIAPVSVADMMEH